MHVALDVLHTVDRHQFPVYTRGGQTTSQPSTLSECSLIQFQRFSHANCLPPPLRVPPRANAETTTPLLTMYACMLTGPVGTETSSSIPSDRIRARFNPYNQSALPAATRFQPRPGLLHFLLAPLWACKTEASSIVLSGFLTCRTHVSKPEPSSLAAMIFIVF